jgi:hypothetical protein
VGHEGRSAIVRVDGEVGILFSRHVRLLGGPGVMPVRLNDSDHTRVDVLIEKELHYRPEFLGCYEAVRTASTSGKALAGERCRFRHEANLSSATDDQTDAGPHPASSATGTPPPKHRRQASGVPHEPPGLGRTAPR